MYDIALEKTDITIRRLKISLEDVESLLYNHSTHLAPQCFAEACNALFVLRSILESKGKDDSIISLIYRRYINV